MVKSCFSIGCQIVSFKILTYCCSTSFDQTLSLFAHSSVLTKREKNLYDNEKWDAEFEVLAPLLSNVFYVSATKHDYLLHANFPC